MTISGMQGQLFFSIIIPLYNRPQEIDELLQSLTLQTYRNFEVLIVEDGSEDDARTLVDGYRNRLDVHYFYIPNGGQGFARNFGFARARGDYFIVFDSDCVVPADYLAVVADSLSERYLDAFGGPDRAHPSFSVLQKAISYAMTSPFTTGGIRGNKRHIGVFHPRSFNMGISREVWERTGGFRWANKSEDMELSMRMHREGFRVGLIADAFVYHKRRATLRQFFRQTFSFGQGRIRIFRHFGSGLKPVHTLPFAFVFALFLLLVLNVLCVLCGVVGLTWGVAEGAIEVLTWIGNTLFFGFLLTLFFHSWALNRHVGVAFWSVVASVTQLVAYGLGFFCASFFGERT